MRAEIIVHESEMCYFESFDDFQVTSNGSLNVYYFPYSGYGPEMWLKNNYTYCDFGCQSEYNIGKAGEWYTVNDFGGSCGYMVMIAVEENDDPEFVEAVTITKKYKTGFNL